MQVLDHEHAHAGTGDFAEVPHGPVVILDQGHGHGAEHPVRAKRHRVLGKGSRAPRVRVAGAGHHGDAAAHDMQHFAHVGMPLVGGELGHFTRHGRNDESAHAVGDAFLEQAFKRRGVELVVVRKRGVDDGHDARQRI